MIRNFERNYRSSTNTLILLDYDGTLVDHSPVPENVKPSEKLLNLMSKLLSNPKIKVVIISGRAHQDLEEFFGHLPMDIVAEHGAMFKEMGKWIKKAVDQGLWRNEVLPIMEEMSLSCQGSFIEKKQFSIAWHYRNSENGFEHSRELIQFLELMLPIYNLKILDGNMVVEVMSAEIGKGKAGQALIKGDNYDYILTIGDDKTDEEMFEFFLEHKNAATVKVGNGSTAAKYRLENVNGVLSLLEKLSK